MPEPSGKPILFIDTTAETLHLAIGTPERMLAADTHVSSSHRHHSAVMIPKAKALLRQAGINISELDGIAVVHGPGSFTGVRTGLITARTLAQFLEIPVYVFNRFELIAEHARQKGETRPVAIYIDALRSRAYHAVVSVSTTLSYPTAPSLIPLDNHTPDDTEAAIRVSPSLSETWPIATQQPQTFPADLDTPALMQSLLARYADAFRQNWRDVHPLYLQEPNITLRKARPGKL